MNLTKSQKELLNCNNNLIVYLGGYLAGKSTAIVKKCLSVNSSIAVGKDLTTLPDLFEEEDIEYHFSKPTQIFKTENSKVMLKTHNSILFKDYVGIKFDLFCIDDFNLLEEERANKLLNDAILQSKQVIITVNPADIQNNNIARNLKYATFIHASHFDSYDLQIRNYGNSLLL